MNVLFWLFVLFYWSMKTSLAIILSIQDNSSPHIANCKVNAVSRSYRSAGIGTCSSPFGSEFCWLLLIPAGRSCHTVWQCHTVWLRGRSNLGWVQSHRLSRLREATLTYIGWLISLLWRQFVGLGIADFPTKYGLMKPSRVCGLCSRHPYVFQTKCYWSFGSVYPLYEWELVGGYNKIQKLAK